MIDKDNIPKDIENLWCYFQSIVKKVVTLGFHPPELHDCIADSIYCGLCQLESDNEEFICCDNHSCPKGRWFHLTCLGLSDNDVPVGEWFCSGQCEVMSTESTKDYKSNQDHIFEYSKALLWRGLGEMACHDAIREGDGDRIVSHWRHDMIEFFYQHHPKYFVCGYNLLSALNGGMSSHLAHQLRWNRTVNTAGKVGHNLEMDMEFFNREYKEAVKTACGNLTDDTIAKHSQTVGI
ncbi:hypothetical protein ACJMK2_002229 [Sinanodonta woodiana]|uniref:Zinc finger PHD-type domain-containing protein n=1 Tax=Sinanodonta woodiana TaxID=1069815 RepID=A0ABD3XUR0_SINWO